MKTLYQNAMEHCAPPEELKERLQKRVFATQPPAEARRVFHPRGFFRRAALAAILAAILCISAVAAVVANWDAILSRRFGEEAAETPMGQAAFQEVLVTSICDDVTLTVRQALCSDKTVYLVLDYHLPATVDPAWMEEICADEDAVLYVPKVSFYATGEVAWEELQEADGALWADLDWGDTTSYSSYLSRSNFLFPYRFLGGASSRVESQGYDAASGTLTYLLEYTAKSTSQSLGDQPLTILVGPPCVEKDGTSTPLADHPALLTFQPEYSSQTLTGTYRDEAGCTLTVTLSPFAINVDTYGAGLESLEDLYHSVFLILSDGTRPALTDLTLGCSGSAGGPTGAPPTSVSLQTTLSELLDVSQVEAVEVGSFTVEMG